jgi:bifunctional UDP-N-acetylglucosamine pyrophosphorylase / glucosamine-1-phosphate N-acetyltransferase
VTQNDTDLIFSLRRLLAPRRELLTVMYGGTSLAYSVLYRYSVELRSALSQKIARLIEKGVSFPNPLTVDIGDEVEVDRISGKDVKIYPGCRIYGQKTVISERAQLGREGPATIENCQLGPEVELKGGYFHQSVFLEKSTLGLGAQVREACVLEEQAGGAHCVGIKQTILFPFVTLGSLINFCDCLMAGGTSRNNHSEVGSSYIHFNFTPDGDKTTPSLLGDVARGVMLNQPPIFLGGQGGLVGPLRLGFGNVVAAGCVLRDDVFEDGRLIYAKSRADRISEYSPRVYPKLTRMVENNLTYLANLAALEQWYIYVRQPFFQEQELGDLVYHGVLEKLAMAVDERCKRFKDMAGKLVAGTGRDESAKRALSENAGRLRELFAASTAQQVGNPQRDLFLTGLQKNRKTGAGYIEAIQGLPTGISSAGTQWLEQIVGDIKRILNAALGPR